MIIATLTCYHERRFEKVPSLLRRYGCPTCRARNYVRDWRDA